jgi:thioester reductase-like protein
MADQRTILITGWPGFIGRRLVDRLLADDAEAKIVALTEANFAATPAPDRVEVVAGDISAPRLGLDVKTYGRLTGEVNEVFHLAAIYNLAVPFDLAQRVNVEGTANVLDFCAACSDLKRLNYISTAYVAGDRTGVVYEHELAEGQGFKNHYESTKYQAEVWVRERLDDIPTTIYRPAIVVGDSNTGETQKFDGPYYMLRSISAFAKAKRPMMNIGNAKAPFNVVPVNFIVDAIATASQLPQAEGRTLQLVDPDPVSAAELIRLLALHYNDSKPAGKIPPILVETSLRFKVARNLLGNTPRESIAYLNHAVRFDTREAGEILGSAGLKVPRLHEYIEPVVEFFKANEHKF